MKNITSKYKWFLLGLIVVGLFYWYEYRPMQIIKYCHERANKALMGNIYAKGEMEKTYDWSFQDCMRYNGFE